MKGTAVTTTMAETGPIHEGGTAVVTGGVDTHLDTNMAAALDGVGGELGVKEFPTTAAGYRDLLGWLRSFGTVGRVGVEGSGSYGAGLARFLGDAGVTVVEVDCPNRQNRRRRGKNDPIDALSAARATLSGDASGLAKTRNGAVEAIRVLRVARVPAPAVTAPRPSTRCGPWWPPPPTISAASCVTSPAYG